jgi:hypothetical protein
MCGGFILKKNLYKQKSEKFLQKLVVIPFSFLLYKIAAKKNARALKILVQSNLYSNYIFGCTCCIVSPNLKRLFYLKIFIDVSI